MLDANHVFNTRTESHPAVADSCCCCSFLFKDQFIELTTSVPQDSDLYGVGETTLPTGLLLPRDGNVITMWARDSASAEPEINIYGAHPFYLQLDKGAGLFLGGLECGAGCWRAAEQGPRVLVGMLPCSFCEHSC